jgi:hypothetical protein
MLRDMSNVAALYDAPDTPSALTRPLSLAQVAAGFPSPADDHLDRDLDLHELLIQHPAATYYVRERKVQTSEILLQLAMIRLMVRRLAKSTP